MVALCWPPVVNAKFFCVYCMSYLHNKGETVIPIPQSQYRNPNPTIPIKKMAMASHLSSTKKNVDICGGGRRAVDARSGGALCWPPVVKGTENRKDACHRKETAHRFFCIRDHQKMVSGMYRLQGGPKDPTTSRYSSCPQAWAGQALYQTSRI